VAKDRAYSLRMKGGGEGGREKERIGARQVRRQCTSPVSLLVRPIGEMSHIREPRDQGHEYKGR